MEKFKLSIATLPLIAGFGAFYYYSEESLLYRVIGLLVAAGLSVLIAAQSEHGRTALAFVRDSRTELRKVVWPTRKETAQTTMFVLGAAIIAGLFFWVIDMFLGWAVRFLTG